MYILYQIVKPNGEKFAYMDEETAVEVAVRLSKEAGNQQHIFYKLECEEEKEDGSAGEEWVVQTRVYQAGEIMSQNEDRYAPPQVIPAPGVKKAKKTGLTPEQKAARDKEKAEAKEKRDADKAIRVAERALAKEEREKLRAEKRAQRDADKANRPPRGSRSKLPEDGLIHMLRPDNPKREGSASRIRYGWYKDGMTVKEYKEINKDYGSLDLAWDIDHGFIKVTNADGSDLTVPTPIEAPSADAVAAAPAEVETPAEAAVA